MPKTAGDLWGDIVSWDNLVAAYMNARRGKRFKPDIMRFHLNWEEELLNIHNHLIWGSWQPKPFSAFPVYEPKERLIEAPHFSDRIVHHAMHRVLEPYFERRFIHHSYACRRGKGTHAACAAVQKLIRRAQKRWGRVYVLQGDIRKYFPSIVPDILLRLVRRVIRDERVVDLWERIVRCCGPTQVGLPVGVLTSQLGANVYLDPFDHYVTDDLGYGLYVRYMDDWVILGPSKQELWKLLGHLEEWLQDNLCLRLSKYGVYPAAQGVDFAGYRTWSTHILPRKRNTKRARRRIKRLARLCALRCDKQEALRAVKASFWGYTKFCSGATTWKKVDEETLG